MDASQVSSSPIFEMSSEDLADHLTKAFEGYIVPFHLDGQQFDSRLRPESLDSFASRIWFLKKELLGISFIARRGWTSRLAAMAIAPNFRNLGFGSYLMRNIIGEAQARGDKRMVLEVIEQNPPAIGLYESVGFKKRRRLVGYARKNSSGSLGALKDIDPVEFTRIMGQECNLDLPWDFWPETLCAKAPPSRALTIDKTSYALITPLPSGSVVLYGIFTCANKRSQGNGSRLMEAVMHEYRGLNFVTPIAVPDQLAPGFFSKLGFVENTISQFEMELSLDS